MQVTDLSPSVQVLRRVLVGSSTSQVPSSLSIRVRPSSVSSELASINVQSKLAAIIKAIPAENVPVISQGEIVSQLGGILVWLGYKAADTIYALLPFAP
jgi:hypothetical protein